MTIPPKKLLDSGKVIRDQEGLGIYLQLTTGEGLIVRPNKHVDWKPDLQQIKDVICATALCHEQFHTVQDLMERLKLGELDFVLGSLKS